jgi:hypothetical protein
MGFQSTSRLLVEKEHMLIDGRGRRPGLSRSFNLTAERVPVDPDRSEGVLDSKAKFFVVPHSREQVSPTARAGKVVAGGELREATKQRCCGPVGVQTTSRIIN